MLASTLRKDLCSGWDFLVVPTSLLLVTQISYLNSVGVTWKSYPMYLDKEITALALLCMYSSSDSSPVICSFRCACDSLTYKADSVPCLHGRSRGHSQGLVTLLGTCLLFSRSPGCTFQPYFSGIFSLGFWWNGFTTVSRVCLQRVSSPVSNSLRVTSWKSGN